MVGLNERKHFDYHVLVMLEMLITSSPKKKKTVLRTYRHASLTHNNHMKQLQAARPDLSRKIQRERERDKMMDRWPTGVLKGWKDTKLRNRMKELTVFPGFFLHRNIGEERREKRKKTQWHLKPLFGNNAWTCYTLNQTHKTNAFKKVLLITFYSTMKLSVNHWSFSTFSSLKKKVCICDDGQIESFILHLGGWEPASGPRHEGRVRSVKWRISRRGKSLLIHHSRTIRQRLHH